MIHNTKFSLIVLVLLACVAFNVNGQGTFVYANIRAPTRLYSMDGPLAGPGIWAHMLYGETPEDLQPISIAREHFSNGTVYGGTIVVPDHDFLLPVYMQMVAWDGVAWGTALEGVPSDQLGRTDVVLHYLAYGSIPPQSPFFTQPAIVPVVPEPSTVAMALLGVGMLALGFRRRRSSRQ